MERYHPVRRNSLNNMKEINITQMKALDRLRLSNPKMFQEAIRLRKEHSILMDLSPEEAERIQFIALSWLIDKGILKKRANIEDLINTADDELE